MKSRVLKDAITLCIITLIAGLLLASVNAMTEKTIAQEKVKSTNESYRLVLKDGKTFNSNESLEKIVKASSKVLKKSGNQYGKNGVVINKILFAKSSSGQKVGYVIDATSKDGYGGKIELAVGINGVGEISGVEILDINETVGLGMNSKKESFRRQYLNKKVEAFEVSKSKPTSDDQIQAISGATITSKAFTNTINASLYIYQHNLKGGN